MEQRFGPYVVGETIGRGNFAKVKTAIHEATGQRVALKIIPRRVLEGDAAAGRKIAREIEILRLLHHPHIMRLYDVLHTRSDIVLVLEHVGGGELFDHLARKGRLDEPRARHLFQQLLSGVAYCHRFRVAHRDLKPENIMLTGGGGGGGGGAVKIGDFGLSGFMRDGAFFRTSCGTPNYAAPEIVSGRPYCGAEADVWSCGVVLFTMVCGRLPFDEDYVQVLFKKIQRAAYSIPAHVSPLARDLLQRMLVVNPLERATVEQLASHPWVAPGFPASLLRYVRCTDAGDAPRGEGAARTVDEAVVGEVARRLRLAPSLVLSVVCTRLAAASAAAKPLGGLDHVSGTGDAAKDDIAEGGGGSVGEGDRNVFVAYSILLDRKEFISQQRAAQAEQHAAQSAASTASARSSTAMSTAIAEAASASTQSLGAHIAAQHDQQPAAAAAAALSSFGALPSFAASFASSASFSATHVRSPAALMPPVPNNALGLPDFGCDGITAAGEQRLCTVKEYNGRQPAQMPAVFRLAPRRTSINTTGSGSSTDAPTSEDPAPPLAPGPATPPPALPVAGPPLDAFRCGAMLEATNARLAMKQVYAALVHSGLLWKVTGPFALIAATHSPPARLHVTLYRRCAAQPQHFLVDIRLPERAGIAALELAHELHARLVSRLRRRTHASVRGGGGGGSESSGSYYACSSSSTGSTPSNSLRATPAPQQPQLPALALGARAAPVQASAAATRRFADPAALTEAKKVGCAPPHGTPPPPPAAQLTRSQQ